MCSLYVHIHIHFVCMFLYICICIYVYPHISIYIFICIYLYIERGHVGGRCARIRGSGAARGGGRGSRKHATSAEGLCEYMNIFVYVYMHVCM